MCEMKSYLTKKNGNLHISTISRLKLIKSPCKLLEATWNISTEKNQNA